MWFRWGEHGGDYSSVQGVWGDGGGSAGALFWAGAFAYFGFVGEVFVWSDGEAWGCGGGGSGHWGACGDATRRIGADGESGAGSTGGAVESGHSVREVGRGVGVKFW